MTNHSYVAAATTVSPSTSTTPEQYIRLAAAISFFVFIVGYDPARFRGLLNRLLRRKALERDKAMMQVWNGQSPFTLDGGKRHNTAFLKQLSGRSPADFKQQDHV